MEIGFAINSPHLVDQVSIKYAQILRIVECDLIPVLFADNKLVNSVCMLYALVLGGIAYSQASRFPNSVNLVHPYVVLDVKLWGSTGRSTDCI